jgi:hypothetical protein
LDAFQKDDKLTTPIGNKIKIIYNKNNTPVIVEPIICKLGEDYILAETVDFSSESLPEFVFVYGTLQAVMAVAKDRLME